MSLINSKSIESAWSLFCAQLTPKLRCREEGLPTSLFAPFRGELPVDGKVCSDSLPPGPDMQHLTRSNCSLKLSIYGFGHAGALVTAVLGYLGEAVDLQGLEYHVLACRL